MFSPDPNDVLKNRRTLAMLAAANGFFIFPAFIILCSHYLKTSDSLCGDLIKYMGVSLMGPVLGYLYAAHNQDKKNANSPSA